MKIYLDNCCYNRPYDDLRQLKIEAEAKSKIFIQSLVSYGAIDLVYSFVLLYEINQIRFEDTDKKENILEFINGIENKIYVGKDLEQDILKLAKEIMQTGVKNVDALHVACAIIAKCDYFISTDKRLLKYNDTTQKITLLNPIDFEYLWRKENG